MIDPSEFAALNANAHSYYNQLQAQNAAQQVAAPKKKPGNFLTHLFPALGGLGGGALGGAAGGAAAGTAILPGVGTAVGGLLGALAGGAAGGAAGKVAENATEHQKLTSGVGGQALEQGLLSAGPLRLVKGAATAGKAALEGGTGLADALAQGGAVDAKLAEPGLLSRARSAISTKGQQMEARAGGFGVGEKASGGVQLGVNDSNAVGDLLKSNGIKAGSPETRLAAVEDRLGTLGKQIDTHLNANNATLRPADVKQISSDFLSNVDQQAGNTPGVQKWAKNYADNFENQVKDTKGLVTFRRQLDKQVINFNQNPQGALVDKQLAARAFRSVLNDTTDKLAPGISHLNHSYSDLTDASGFLKGGAKAVSDQSQGGGGIVSRALTNDTAQAAKSKLGSFAQALGGDPERAVDPYSLPAIVGRSLPANLAIAGNQSLGQFAQNQNTTQPINSSAAIPSSDISSALSDTSPDSSSSPFDPANIETNIGKLLAGGASIDDVSKYVSLATSINGLQTSASQANSADTVKPTGQQYGLAQGGLNSLQQLAQIMQQDPSVVAKNSVPGQGLPLIGSYITNAAGAGDYHALADNVLQSLIHLQTGATATPEEVKAARGQLPAPGDSAEERQRKLSNLSAMFSPYVTGGQLGSSNGASSLLSALGGASA